MEQQQQQLPHDLMMPSHIPVSSQSELMYHDEQERRVEEEHVEEDLEEEVLEPLPHYLEPHDL